MRRLAARVLDLGARERHGIVLGIVEPALGEEHLAGGSLASTRPVTVGGERFVGGEPVEQRPHARIEGCAGRVRAGTVGYGGEVALHGEVAWRIDYSAGAATALPAVAIGGISAADLPALRRAGLDGAAPGQLTPNTCRIGSMAKYRAKQAEMIHSTTGICDHLPRITLIAR